jgi:hypothetical protein
VTIRKSPGSRPGLGVSEGGSNLWDYLPAGVDGALAAGVDGAGLEGAMALGAEVAGVDGVMADEPAAGAALEGVIADELLDGVAVPLVDGAGLTGVVTAGVFEFRSVAEGVVECPANTK